MSDELADLHKFNIVGDIAAGLDFYGRLGMVVSQGEEMIGARVALKMPGGFSLELDAPQSARM